MTDQLSTTVAPYGLRCEHRVEPLGVGTHAPLLSWRLTSARRGDTPAGHRVVVSTRDETVWDSGDLAGVREATGVRVVHVEPGVLVCRLTSGDFHFTSAVPQE